MMHIGVLETGRPAPQLVAAHGDYVDMVTRLFAGESDISFSRYWLQEEPLPALDACDAYVITGSRCSVLDEAPWMLALEDFLRRARAARRRVIGICFGHQILAKALGGRVEKAATGWRLGLNSYALDGAPDWLNGAKVLRINAIHQDQVVVAPEGARKFATGVDCPVAALAYDDWAVSVQAHPEFTMEFERSLLTTLRGVTLSEGLADQALATLDAPGAQTDSADIAKGFAAFLRKGQRAD
ncbi:GMP synthase (glutamine-hydrolyzing) [Rhodoblastus acidophilus]|uniref:glutamine amidotransferase-related protein n=1 Tax=Rhodoblastus acidophilus TaxID=1074 RepID=UPI0022252D07|nr:type 1 glutamine amidotransferase [Rhodoblastus acidophilus]MCW2316701.1 GMP synthase (glutamine-hydrolyzing) [Rhodoblastus acidophilus]